MRKNILVAMMVLFTGSGMSHAEELSASGWYAVSGGVVSLGSSALVSGIILSPVLLPLSLIVGSVEKNKEQKTALIRAKTPDDKEVKLQVPLNVVEEGNLKAGDTVSLEKAPEGAGAYLKKEGKVLTHMLNQQDAGLSGSQAVPAK